MTRSLTRTLLALATVAAAWGGVSGSATAATGGFVVQPNVADTTCNAGQGIELPSHAWKSSATASGLLGDGSTLTAFGQIYPGQDYVVLDAVNAQCQPDSSFGTNGTSQFTIPAGLVPKPGRNATSFGLWVNSITPRSDGGALVAGIYRDRWVIGSVTAQGLPDPSFGTGGWEALPLHGEASQVLQEASGEIIVGGDNEGGGCCNVTHAVALTSDGSIDTAWGTNGRVTLPTGEDSGVAPMSVLPNGDLLTQVAYGNMGCWGLQLAMFTSSGQPVAGFGNRLGRFWRNHSFGAFVGDVYVDGSGFTLVGTGQRPCADGRRISAKSAHGVLVHFNANGSLNGPVVRFASKLYGQIGAFKRGSNTLLAETGYGSAATSLLRMIGPTGAAVTTFGKTGVVTLRLPWQAAQPTVIDAGGAELVAVATADEQKQFGVIRLSV